MNYRRLEYERTEVGPGRATGNYTAFGYEHFDTNNGEVSSDPDTAYIAFIHTQPEETKLRTYGFIQQCEMNVNRGGVDGGALSLGNNGAGSC